MAVSQKYCFSLQTALRLFPMNDRKRKAGPGRGKTLADGQKTVLVRVKFPESELADVDAAASGRDTDRSDFIRTACRNELRNQPKELEK
jgi:hypothetical protein